MQRITRDNEISYVVSLEELKLIRSCEINRFAEWCKTKGYGCYDWQMLMEEYEKEQK